MSDDVEISVFRSTEEIPRKTLPKLPDARAEQRDEDHGSQSVTARPGLGTAVEATPEATVEATPDAAPTTIPHAIAGPETAVDSAVDASSTAHRDD
ncbi:hypothetical protein [Protofrankia coriariae]|uniref:Uncharacterized protein n=1 Tax=Protofrankia coriariae TaxID=1562887 RepID=A0ABR5F7D4_9ACTN|nr:hypothetical protein [Protofrankia coriariae]KLL12636.1 hypothetical protein FrCorBMG51_02895 [Protofrankia coriariae]